MVNQEREPDMKTSPPVVEEVHLEDRVVWLLSFSGSNPKDDQATDDKCIELTKDQCLWLQETIMNIDQDLFERARKLYKS